jgi:hypothetical protein
MIKQTSIGMAGAATLGVLAAAPHLAGAAPAHSSIRQPSAALSGPLVAHVRDFNTGEIAVLIGEREVIYRDPDLVMRLLKAAG